MAVRFDWYHSEFLVAAFIAQLAEKFHGISLTDFEAGLLRWLLLLLMLGGSAGCVWRITDFRDPSCKFPVPRK